MKSNDLPNIITNFINDNNRSILIDGPWGCGKTFQIKEYIEKKSKRSPRIYYASLFGRESIDEINTELYAAIHPKKVRFNRFFGKGLSLISKAISPIPYAQHASGLADAIGFAINDISNKSPINDVSNKKVKKDIVVIFDDLERVAEALSYVSLLGYFNQLFLSGIKILSICSLKNISKDKQNEFNDFKEKVFDRIYVIDESNDEIIGSYFTKYSLDNINNIINEFDNNIRLAQRVGLFFGEILSYSKEKKYKIVNKITYLQLLRNCILTVKLCFNHYETPIFPQENSDKLYKTLRYEEDVKTYGENIANGLFSILDNNENYLDLPIETFSRNLITSLLDVFLFQKYDDFDNMFQYKIVKSKDDDFLNNDIFYLSDENKIKYSENFFNRLLSGDIVFDKTNIKRFSDILMYSEFVIDEKLENKIIELIIEQTENNYESNNITAYLDSIKSSSRDLKNQELIKGWINQINEARVRKIIQLQLDKLKEIYEVKDYSGLDGFLNDLEIKSEIRGNKEIIDYIVSHDFLLPDLSGDMTYYEWIFSHEMAKYAVRIGKSDEFKDVAVKICLLNPENYSLLDRFQALIHYRIDSKFNLYENLK